MTQSEQIRGNDTSILAQYKLPPTFNLFLKKSNKAKLNKMYLFYYTQYKVCIVGSYFKIYYTSDYFFPSVTTPKLRCSHSVCEIQSILRGLSSSYSYLKTIFSTASSVIVFKSKQHLIPPLLHPLYHT